MWLHNRWKSLSKSRLGEETIITKLLHIVETIQQITIKYLSTNMSKNDQCYYVNMFQSPAMIEKQPQDINVINLYANNLKMLQGIQLLQIWPKNQCVCKIFFHCFIYLWDKQKE